MKTPDAPEGAGSSKGVTPHSVPSVSSPKQIRSKAGVVIAETRKVDLHPSSSSKSSNPVSSGADSDRLAKAQQELRFLQAPRYGGQPMPAAAKADRIRELKAEIKTLQSKNSVSKIHDIAEGKYHVKNGTRVGKAHMEVRADGTGVYVNSRGERKELSAAQVKKNFDAGMGHNPASVSSPSSSSL